MSKVVEPHLLMSAPRPPPRGARPPRGTRKLGAARRFLEAVSALHLVDALRLPAQALAAELFRVSLHTANEHLKTPIVGGELAPEATILKFPIFRQEGERSVSWQIDRDSLGECSLNRGGTRCP